MNEQQYLAFKIAESGHNLFLAGSPGTGKTYTLGKIIERLRYNGKTVAVTASTGMAASVLRENVASNVITLHRFTGIKDGRFDHDEITALIQGNEAYIKYKNNICSTETLIIDEISMISRKIFNQIDYIFRHVRNNIKPFGGIQLILSGDLLQLPPVPNRNYGDDGTYFIKSDLMQHFHLCKLTKVVRQEEEDLVCCINELARGEISISSEQLLHRLKRTLPPGKTPVKIFAKNLDVDIWNAKCLLEMEGETKIYICKDDGDVSGIEVPEKIHLKVGCEIILTVNLSDELVNGLRGTVFEMKDESVVCFFATQQKNVEIKQYAFQKYDVAAKKDVGSRSQIPLRLGYAITVHKSQGMTLDRVSIDCKGMFQYGQLVVSISRVKKKIGLQVLNFTKMIVQRPPAILINFYDKPMIPIQDNMTCCVHYLLDSESQVTHELLCETHDTDYDDSYTDVIQSDDEFETEFVQMMDDFDKERAEPPKFPIPDDVNIETVLKHLLHDQTITETQSAENTAIKYLMEKAEDTKKIVQFLWDEIMPITEQYFAEGKEIENKNVTEFYQKYNDIVTGDNYKLRVKLLLGHNPSPAEYNVVFKLSTKVRFSVLQLQSKPVWQAVTQRAEVETGKTFLESKGGRGKIRYLAGWCLFKLKNTRKKSISNNLYKKEKVQLIQRWVLERDLIEHLESTEAELMDLSSDIESLHETVGKQNIRKGLTNVSDSCFEFFTKLNTKILLQQTEVNLNLYGANFYHFLTSQLLNDMNLRVFWENLFESFEKKNVGREILSNLFDEIIKKFCLMSVKQLRKDYLQSKKTKKKEATRKQIKMRTDSDRKKQFNMESIISDKTLDKVSSHKRLQSEILQEDSFLERVFTKKDLLLFCKAYGIKEQKSVNKQRLSDILRPVILEKLCIPNVNVFGGEQIASSSSIHTETGSSENKDQSLPGTSSSGGETSQRGKRKGAVVDAEESDESKKQSKTVKTSCSGGKTSQRGKRKGATVDTEESDESKKQSKTVKTSCSGGETSQRGKRKGATVDTEESDESKKQSKTVKTSCSGGETSQRGKRKGATVDTEESDESKKQSKTVQGKGKKKKKKGPIKWPCGLCGKDANFNSVGCDGCDVWYHVDCLKIENVDDLPEEWFCGSCQDME